MTHSVANALSRRFNDLGQLDVTVILDPDPEVYRLGFGDYAALETIRAASAKNLFDLREQPGVRIGVIVSDETTLVYAPVSRNIEAGSTSVDKPNAVILSGSAADRIVEATGSDGSKETRTAEVGNTALEPAKVQAMQADLMANPPKPFDITRKLNVFTSKVQYVEFSASNYRLTTRQIPLPPDLVDVADDDLKNRISSRIRAPFDDIGKLDVIIDDDGKVETIKVDDDFLRKERKRIEDEYTFPIANFGRVILNTHRDAFNRATEQFQSIVKKYQAALRDALLKKRSKFEKRIVDEFSGRWAQNPPKRFAHYDIEPTPERIEIELQQLANEIFDSAITFEAPVVKIVYKNVAPENVRSSSFLETLKRTMITKRVPREIIYSLFESGQAAPEAGSFL